MKTFNKALISTAFALVASNTDAKAIHNSCLTMSDQTAGAETGTFMTNEAQLTGSTVTDQMRIHSITTCTDTDYVSGLQFIMALNPYESVDEELITMDPIGKIEGTCKTVKLPEGLDEIKSSFREESSGLSVIYIIRGDINKAVRYGDVTPAKIVDWEFDDANPLVGLYGRQNESGITQLGFITLDTVCQAAREEVSEPVKPTEPEEQTGETTEETTEKVTEETSEEPKEETTEEKAEETTDSTETETTIVVPEEEPTNLDEVNVEKDEGLGMMTIILIVVGIIVFIGLIVATVCTLRYKKNQQNRAATPAKTNTVVRRSGATAKDIENNSTKA